MQTYQKLLSEELIRRGHRLTVISTRHPEDKEYEIQSGLELYYLRDTTFGSKRKGWKAACLKKYIELDEINSFDIIYSISTIIPKKLFAVAAEKKTPIILSSHGTGTMMLLSEIKQIFSQRRGRKNLFKIILLFIYYYLFMELSLKKYDAIIAVSDEVAKSTLKWYFVERRKVYTVHNGVETNLFRPDQEQREHTRKALAILNKEKVLLFFSVVTKQKGLHLLIKALPTILKNNKCVKLMIIGEGEYLDEARLMVEQSGLEDHAFFTGHIPREMASHYINASDIFIMPTLRQEGLPFSLIEAMACQKPVIVSRIGGISSVIDDGINGLLIQPGDVSKLAEKVIFLLDNKDFSDKLAKNGRDKVVQKFSLEHMVEGTIKVFEMTKKLME
ncbi:MAG: glycosyltransferase family 4 protein [Candidatus Scalindua sp.]|nr:glycosyltransferase family 4 protein [Candidatus Scalindua sp.]